MRYVNQGRARGGPVAVGKIFNRAQQEELINLCQLLVAPEIGVLEEFPETEGLYWDGLALLHAVRQQQWRLAQHRLARLQVDIKMSAEEFLGG